MGTGDVPMIQGEHRPEAIVHIFPFAQPTTGPPGSMAPATEGSHIDPDQRAPVTRLTRLLVAAVLLAGLGYLAWRTTTIGRGWILALSVPVLWAEIWSWLQLLLLRFQVVPTRRGSQAGSPIHADAIDVVIAVGSDSTPADLERTLIGLAVTGWRRPTTVLTGELAPDPQAVVDHFHSTTGLHIEIRHIDVGAIRSGIDTSIGSGLLSSITDIGEGEWLLWLEAGQVPMPQLFQAITQSTADVNLAVRQFAVGLLNPNSLFHLKRGGDEEALEREVIGPALASRGVAPWRGAASLVRRTALRESAGGGPSNRPLPELAIALYRHGWCTDYDPRPLIRDLAPDSLQPYLVARRDRSVAALIGLGAAFTRRYVPWPARWAALAAGVSLTYGLRQLAMLSVLTAGLLVGRLPFVAELTTVVAGMIGFAAVNMVARRLLSGGIMSFGDWTRHGWRTLGADVAALASRPSLPPDRPAGTRSSARRDALGQLRLLVAAFGIFEVAFAARAINTMYPTLLPTMSRLETTVLVVVALVVTYTMADMLGVLVLHRQRRRAPRIPLEADIAVAGRRGTTLDVTPIGVGAVLESAPSLGAIVPVRFSVPRADGTGHEVETTAWIRAATPHESGLVRVGMEFDDLSDRDRIALTEYCALGVHRIPVGPDAGVDSRGSADGSGSGSGPGVGRVTSEAVESNPDDLSIGFSRRDLNLLRLLTAAATTTAVTALFLGPVAGAASAESGGQDLATIPPILTVTVPAIDSALPAELSEGGSDLAGQPLRLRLYTDGWSEPLATDGSGRFVRPDALAAWSDEAFVELVLGPDRHVVPLSFGSDLVLSRLRLAPDIDSDRHTVEMVGPGGRWRVARDGDIVIPGRYTIRLPSVAPDYVLVERIEVGPGQLITIGVDGATIGPAGTASRPTPDLPPISSEPADTEPATVPSTVSSTVPPTVPSTVPSSVSSSSSSTASTSGSETGPEVGTGPADDASGGDGREGER